MPAQISPWSIYDTSFQAVIKQRSITVPQKPIKKQIVGFHGVQKFKSVEKMPTESDQTKSGLMNFKQKLKNMEKCKALSRIEQIRQKIKMQQERKSASKLLEQRPIQEYLHYQLSNCLKPYSMSRPKDGKIYSYRSETVNYDSLSHFSEVVLKKQANKRVHTQKNREKRPTIINYSPFNDYDILRRGVQLMKRRKFKSKTRQSFIVSKCIGN